MDEKENDLMGENLDSFLENLLQDVDTKKESDDYLDDLKMDDPDQDILDLLNSINDGNMFDANHQEEEIFSIDDSGYSGEEFQENISAAPSESMNTKPMQDVGEVFSDALSAVTSLEDFNNEDLLDFSIPTEENDNKAIESVNLDFSKIEETEKTKPIKIKTERNPKNIEYFSPETKKKDSLLKRLFGNKKEERSTEEVEKLKQKAIDEVNDKIQKSEEKKQNLIKEKEAKKKKAAEEAAKKKAEAAKKKELMIKAKLDAEAKKALEIQNLVEEIDENEGKINRIGASIVFVLFAAIAIVIVFGTNIYTYHLNIKNAEEHFEEDRYNEAYNDVYGMDIQDEDIELYDKIMTVMYVNKQLNSYNNYYAMGKYAQALDSLLKGLERYDKYKKLAEKLDIKTDLDNVRKNILTELSREFHLTEEEALEINKNKNDQEVYSLKVHNIVLERMDEKVAKADK